MGLQKPRAGILLGKTLRAIVASAAVACAVGGYPPPGISQGVDNRGHVPMQTPRPFSEPQLYSPAKGWKPTGVLADYAVEFAPGHGLPVDVLKNPAAYQNKILGGPKGALDKALSLGTFGHVIVAYTMGRANLKKVVCFRRNEDGKYGTGAADIYVHEPPTSNNRPETVEVLAATDKVLTPATQWHSLGIKSVADSRNNFIPFTLPHSIELAYYAKVVDAGSKLTPAGALAGFDASAVYFTLPCEQAISFSPGPFSLRK